LSHRKNLKSSGWEKGMGKNVFFPGVFVLVIKDNLPGTLFSFTLRGLASPPVFSQDLQIDIHCARICMDFRRKMKRERSQESKHPKKFLDASGNILNG
jgi:hypothetical protein